MPRLSISANNLPAAAGMGPWPLLARLLLAWLLLMGMSLSHAQDFVPVPALQARVTDLAGMLKLQERARLENVLKEHEDRSGNQVAVLLLPSTAPEAIEQYSIRVADAWKLGRKGVDDGVLLIVARDNPPSLRRLRIEAGRGVQGSLTDAQSKRILQDVIAPHFRQNDFYGGLTAGIGAIHAAIDRENLPAPQRKQQQVDTGDVFDWLPMLVFGAAVLMMLFGRRRRRSAFTSNDWGRSAGVILGSGLGWGTQDDLRGRGGFGSWGGRGGGGGFGGFSGGGGGFDGGGASGNW